ncbi:hypothetical protein [Natrinema salsiterrestre]|uniref:Uncharacterized protein n=1 Tax=Natrinema salsiterrestre TaxID=2950540 RepID=A0A9Q4L3P6_9EURY|nr:hypothetical protein [Natrinema salsiterrestre]MDF9746293.1 hypothetical protein [Natrinema salsiterrestre]
MTYCVEPYVQDLVWLWLENNPAYTQVGGEVSIGSGIHSGRIDLVAKTADGEYHGFEIKNNAFADEQLNRYLNSEYLDKLFHCSRVGESVADRLANKKKVGGGTYTNQQIRKQVSNAIAAGQYTEADYLEALDGHFPDDVLEQSVSVYQTNERILDDEQKTVRARLERNLGIPTADFDPSETYIDLEEAIKRMQNNLLLPDQTGVVDVPLELESTDEQDGFRQPLPNATDDAFSQQKWTAVEVIREGSSLPREHTPTLSCDNETWVQHHVWRAYGHIREAVVPSQQDNAEYLIDVMGFEDGKAPAKIYQEDNSKKLIGVEAKGDSTVATTEQIEEIRAQLERYQSSGVITHLYLAVPQQYQANGEQVLAVDSLSKVGLMTVSRSGEVTITREAMRSEMEFDGYIKRSGSNEYPRSIGFGNLRPRDEPEHVAPCRVG